MRTVKGFTGSPDFSVTIAATRSITLSAFGVSVGSAETGDVVIVGRSTGAGSGERVTLETADGGEAFVAASFAVRASFWLISASMYCAC